MTRHSIAWLFVAGSAAFAAGLLVALASIQPGVAAGLYRLDGFAIAGLGVNPIGYVVVALVTGAAMTLVGGALAVLVAWAAALANALAANRLGWFYGLVILGVPTFGIGALLAYVVAGPDRQAVSG